MGLELNWSHDEVGIFAHVSNRIGGVEMRDYAYINDKKIPLSADTKALKGIDRQKPPMELARDLGYTTVMFSSFGMYGEGVLVCERSDQNLPEAVVIWKTNKAVVFLFAQTFPDVVKVLADISSYEKALKDIMQQYESDRTPFQPQLLPTFNTRSNADLLRQMVSQLVEAENRRDRAAGERILSEDFTGTRENGQEQDRAALLIEIATPSHPNFVRNVSDVSVLAVNENVGVTRSIITAWDQNAPAIPSAEFRNIHVFRYQEGNWRCITWQETRLNP